ILLNLIVLQRGVSHDLSSRKPGSLQMMKAMRGRIAPGKPLVQNSMEAVCSVSRKARQFLLHERTLVSIAAVRLNSREMKPSIRALALCIGFTTNRLAQSATPALSPLQPPAEYDLHWGVKILMRDKVELNATLYLPKTPEGSLSKTPVIFTLTPYISDTYHARAAYFASHGYAFALVDVRSRGNSGGEFEPFANEPRDGHDSVEWFAKQPFYDGKVAMWGGSYADSINGQQRKNFPHIWRQLFRSQL